MKEKTPEQKRAEIVSDVDSINEQVNKIEWFLEILHDHPGSEEAAEWGLTTSMELMHQIKHDVSFLSYKMDVGEL